MRRWMPMGLMLTGATALAVLAVPLIEPSLLWVFAFNPVMHLVWDVATVMATAMVVTGGLWMIARMRGAGQTGGYSR